ncbi:hypothetical protein ACFYY1_42895 [Streptomyces sp. NPDC001890]|uniref:hypothetical protein n=1 Tax=Streptomyces sp. NPDC001890 TaxID=3364620 RepID=UPI0036BCD5B6
MRSTGGGRTAVFESVAGPPTVPADPGAVAELCLSAVPHIALAVTLASADLD